MGLTDNSTALLQWAIVGLEQARLKAQFEKEYLTYLENTEFEYQHHDEEISTQERFHHKLIACFMYLLSLVIYLKRTACHLHKRMC